MTGKTHRIGGVVVCLSGYLLLKNEGMLIANMNPMLQLGIMYPFAIYGSVVSDLDHHWKSAPSKDPVSWVINKALHIAPHSESTLLNAKHRSWQTHSDLFLFLMIALGMYLTINCGGSVDAVFIRLIFMGLTFGIVSHLILDMLTPAGIWSILLMTLKRLFNLRGLPDKLVLVPSSSFFATDGQWEHGVRMVLWVISFILLAVILLGIFG